CLTGVPGSDQLDTMLVLDVDEEFGAVLRHEGEMLPSDVSPQALEYLLGIATELANFGREGRPLGALFVLGDTENVMQYVKPLILNPFRGYAEEDRNVLNPFMDETLKELAHIDGAFVIRGNGVVETAGSMIEASVENIPQHLGLGTRHAAAASITQKTDCLAIVVSQSGQVTLFRRGTMFPLYEKSDRPRLRQR
ncbi:MAG: DNA integrity scanning protein DisA nucleotide-binding domain protein, partial [Opitutales bacterium]